MINGHDALIAELKATLEGSRKLDAKLHAHLHGEDTVFTNLNGDLGAFPDTPAYTTSLDAAQTSTPPGKWHRRCYDNRDAGLSITWELWPLAEDRDGSLTEMYDGDKLIKYVGWHRASSEVAYIIAALKARRAPEEAR